MLDSHGWHILWTRVIPESLRNCTNGVFACVRDEAITAAARQVGRYEGAINVAQDAYAAAKDEQGKPRDLPQHIKDLRRAE